MKTAKRTLSLLLSITASCLALSGYGGGDNVSRKSADMVFTNGKVLTVDEQFSIAEAVAVKDGVIIAVGTDEEIQEYVVGTTKALNLKGGTLMPGLNDAHIHMGPFGTDRPPFTLDVSGANVSSIADISLVVADAVAALGPGEWVRGSGYNLAALEEIIQNPERAPTKEDLDSVSPDNPVILEEFSLHAVWVNSKALELAGITAETPNPEGGTIVKNPTTGEPTGILLEPAATSLVANLVPTYTREQVKQGLLLVSAELNSLGYTSVTDPGGRGIDTWDIYKEILAEGNATLRINALVPVRDDEGTLEAQKDRVDEASTLREELNDEWLRIAGMKMFVDGVAGAKTAWMYEDYSEAVGGGNGVPFGIGETIDEKYNNWIEIIRYANSKELQLGMHTTGDQTADMIVDGLIRAQNGHEWDARHYLIHAASIQPQTITLMGQNNIGVNVQSAIKTLASDRMVSVIGFDRAENQWPLKSFIDAEVNVSNSSDATVTYPDWRKGMASAITRKSDWSENVSGAHERISIEDAIRQYTIGGAWQDHQDDIKGSIEVGKMVDFCIIDRDILAIDPADLSDIEVLMTILDGEIIYNKDPNYLVIE